MTSEDAMLPDVVDYLEGKNIFVTGVTGFVGLVLVEKLLRTVPDIGTIFVLIRPKRGKEIDDRLKEIKDSSIFDTLINSGCRSALNKIVPVLGSIDVDAIGLSLQDQQTLISRVDFVFHCAATLDFEASLKTTVQINLIGTRNMVELCKKMQNLKALVHVSSAYVNADKPEADEVLYEPPDDGDHLLEVVRNLTDTHLEEITPKILDKHPNTYTFTKALAEHEVAKSFTKFPSCIVRPSMIVGAWKEPASGWTNSKNGPQGFIMGASMGVVRRLPVGKHLIYDYIPVDVVANTMIVGAVYVASQTRLREVPIFQCTTSTTRPFRWADVEDQISVMLHKYPLAKAVWYPHLKLLPSVTIYRISAFLFHMIPAYILDGVTKIAGGRPKLVRLHTSVNQSLDRLAPFIFQEWRFDNSCSVKLHQRLSATDRERFGIDIDDLRWEVFFEDMAKGVRRYLHKEKDSTLGKARSKDKILMVANLAVQFALFALIFLLMRSMLHLSSAQAGLVIGFLYMLYSIL